MRQGKNVMAQIHELIPKVMKQIGSIGKSRRNQQQGYSFRGIDDVYSALAPVLSKRQLCILPRVTNRDVMERPTRNGGVMIYTVLTVEGAASLTFTAAQTASSSAGPGVATRENAISRRQRT